MRAGVPETLHLAMFDHGGLPEALLRDSFERFATEVLPWVQSAPAAS
jgi:hypothetical protein